MSMTIHEQKMLNAGYVRSPNNNRMWYPSGTNLPCLPGYDVVILLVDGSILIEGWRNGSRTVLKTFDTIESYFANCTAKSLGGQPAGYCNVWD
jgi:hypothetical protein